MSRLDRGGRVDRTRTVTIRFDGRDYPAHPGDTLASALLANGVRVVARGPYTHRPRGIVDLGAGEPNAYVQVDSGAGEPMVRATQVEVYDGLTARSLAGKGYLSDAPDESRYDKTWTHVDVLVVGGGPAGLAAALAAGRTGARVLLADEQPSLGGGLLSLSGAWSPLSSLASPSPLGSEPLSLGGGPLVLGGGPLTSGGGPLVLGGGPLTSGGEPSLTGGAVPGDHDAWLAAVHADLAALPEVRLLTRTAVTGAYDHRFLVAVERRTDHLGDAAPAHVARQRLWHVRAAQVILATGAFERPILFADGDRPGVMLAGAAAGYATRYGVRPGRRAVVFGAHDGALRAALDLLDAGVELACVLDARPSIDGPLVAALRSRGVRVLAGHGVAGTDADAEGVLAAAHVVPVDARGVPSGPVEVVTCDLLAVSGGWNPNVHLYSQAGGRTEWSDTAAAYVPAGDPPHGYRIVGAARGTSDLAASIAEGARAGAEAAAAAGFHGEGAGSAHAVAGATTAHVSAGSAHAGAGSAHAGAAAEVAHASAGSAHAGAASAHAGAGAEVTLAGSAAKGAVAGAAAARPGTEAGIAPDGTGTSDLAADARAGVTPPGVLWLVEPPAGRDDAVFVDSHRDATLADLRRAVGAGLTSAEHVKRYTTIGTGADQGRSSGVSSIGVLANTLGRPLTELGTTTYRPPTTPISFALLAGRNRGRLLDPERHTPMHGWHAAREAVFENVGQWKRPWYYPAPGEDLHSAVERECRAAREGVAMMDVSTLGKLDLQGPDVGEFLDRIYTNKFSNLAVGQCRYGVMCRPDGMIFDDGVTARLSSGRYHMTTTTGNAAAVLDWLDEWLQTEWPELRVHATSVTDQWAAVAVVGPRARDVMRALAPELDLSAEAFPFMTVRDANVAGIPARVFRISFTGELSYEINVPAWDGLALWEAVFEAGRPLGITPYGTETMHVLRAEKGYIVVGQDTDGTVTPQDAGLGWAVSKVKHFIGERSYRRPDTARADRKRLVALFPTDPETVVAEGAQLVLDPDVPPPTPMLGHVTSSYRSAALGRSFALGLVAGGLDRLGETVFAVSDGTVHPVVVAEPIVFDKEGTRRDGDPHDGTDAHDNGDGDPHDATEPHNNDDAQSDANPHDGIGTRNNGEAHSHGDTHAYSHSDTAPAVVIAKRTAPAPRYHGGSAAVALTELVGRTHMEVRVDAYGPAATGLATALGHPLPAPGQVAGDATRSTLWLGPGWYLVVGQGDPAAVPGAAVVDVSAGRAVLELTGPRARTVLEHGCSLDLHPRAFSTGSCAQTNLALAQVLLHQVGPERYHVFVRSSFADYLAEWLLDAMTEYVEESA